VAGLQTGKAELQLACTDGRMLEQFKDRARQVTVGAPTFFTFGTFARVAA
jgi:hypothetical protein